jgi:hypothetical protein
VKDVERREEDKRKDVEFPPWEPIDYWLQTKEYFMLIKRLNNIGLNLKINLTNMEVSESDLV